jgi:hypothetical protein
VNDTVNQSRDISKDDSKIRKKGGKKKKSTENFVEAFVNVINQIRSNPPVFATKILESIANIKSEEGKLIFDANGTKVSLSSGEEIFRNVAEKLMTTDPMSPLEYTDDLVIPVPEDQKEWKDNKLISQLLAKKKSELGGKYSDCVFNMDLGVSEAELSALLQIVDDSPFKGKRRENLLNPNNRFIGISYVSKPKNKFCCYITFAK